MRVSFPVADPGFPIGGMWTHWGHGPPMLVLFAKNVCKNKTIGFHRGGHAPGMSPRSANAFHNRFDTKIKSDLSIRFNIEIKSDPEIGLETKPNLTLKLANILKLNMALELGFRVKFVCIQNFKLILNIL